MNNPRPSERVAASSPTAAERTARKIIALRTFLIEYAADHSLEELLTQVLDRTEQLVSSPISFFHFIDPDQQTISLQQWSSSTLTHFCRTEGRGLHYPVDRAGVWADCLRQRQPVIHNDYPGLEEKRGLPPGHAAITRELVVPVLRDGRVTAILGVGNKLQPYDQTDVETMVHVADVAWEIIARKQGENLQRLQQEIESACAELSAFLLSSRDLAQISLKVLDVARDLTKSAYGFVGAIDRETGHLISHSLTRDILESCRISKEIPVFHEFAGLWGWVLRHGQSLLTNEAESDPRAGGLPPGHVAIKAFLGVPAISAGRVVGIIALANPRHSFMAIDLTIARRMADLYALAIERHALESDLIAGQVKRAEELEEQVTKRTAELRLANQRLFAENQQRREAEAALAAEKEMAQRYLELARVGFIALDRADKITMANPYMEQVLGVPADRLLGRSWHDFAVIRRDLDASQAEIAETLASAALPPDRQHLPLRTARGLLRVFSCNAVQITDGDGASVGTLISGEDVTERLTAERQLRAGRIRMEILAAIMKNTPLAMVFYVADRESVRILDWNTSAERIFGWSKEEVLGRDFMTFLPDDLDFGRVQDVYTMLRQTPGAHNLSNWCNCKSGEKRLIHWFNNSFLEERTESVYVVSLGDDITEQHEFDQRLRQSEEKLRTIADFTFDWEDWRGPDGQYLYVSPSCERTTGYRREEFLVDSNLTLDIVHPQDRSFMAEHLLAESRDREIHRLDFRIRNRAGQTRWISHCCQPVYDEHGQWLGRRSSNRDITDRKLAEQAVTDSRNMLQMVFDGIREPLVLMEEDGRILMMNATARKYFRVREDHDGSGYCWELIGDAATCDNQDGLPGCRDCRVLGAIRAGENCDFERRGVLDPSRSEHVFVDIVKNQRGLRKTAILRIYDITLTRQMEKDLQQADKMIALGTLVSGVAHEINNPNNFISLNINLLKDAWASFRTVLDRQYQEYGDFLSAGLPYSEMRDEVPNLLIGIEAGSRRIQRIVQELKDYSMPSLDRMDELLNINQVVQQAVALIDSKTRQYTDDFQVEYGSGLPAVRGSGQKLEQVVINLLLNACQSLARRKDKVRVVTSYHQASQTVRVAVEDQGVGIEAAKLEQIMDPFFTTKRGAGGTGLGLSVSSRIIAEHRGRIEVQSQPGKGSTFSICLPIAPSENKHQH